MIESVHFKNFKALRDTTLPLGPFTLLVGPNGSGKSTALQALTHAGRPARLRYSRIASVGAHGSGAANVELVIRWTGTDAGITTLVIWRPDGGAHAAHLTSGGENVTAEYAEELNWKLSSIAIYSLDAGAIAAPSRIRPGAALDRNGGGLAAVLDQLSVEEPSCLERINHQLSRWLPEFERVRFGTPSEGYRAIKLQVRGTQQSIPAEELSQGTLLVLAMLTLAYLPNPPMVTCFEEPDRAIHPRLLRRVQDALYRLAYPESDGEDRAPVQVIATTHNPYFVDLFGSHPEEVVIADKEGLEATFHRIVDIPHAAEILEGPELGETWYTGVLGGVPARS